MARTIITTAGFCAGVGMLDEGVRLGLDYLGFDARPALLCEWDAYAAAVLLARMEDEALEPCPVWCGDLGDFDGRPWRGAVDCFAAGLPCQPYSVAGKQRGNDDHRSWGDGDGPLPNFLRIVAECRPALVLLENVPAWVRGGWFRPFGEELCRLGYTIEKPLFITAESVGASHRRERVFILAHAQSSRAHDQQPRGEGEGVCDFERNGKDMAEPAGDRGGQAAARQTGRRPHSDERGGAVADTQRQSGGEQEPGRRQNRGTAAGRSGAELGDTSSNGRRQGPEVPQGRQSVPAAPSIFAPGPGDFDGWSGVVADGSFDFRAPAIKPGLRMLADGVSLVVDASRADQLRCVGNACVATQAAVAFVELMREARLT